MASGTIQKPMNFVGTVCTKVLNDTTNKATRNIYIPSNARLYLIVESSSNSRCGVYLVVSDSSGNVYPLTIANGSDISTNNSSHTFTTTSGTSSRQTVMVFSHEDNLSTVEYITTP